MCTAALHLAASRVNDARREIRNNEWSSPASQESAPSVCRHSALPATVDYTLTPLSVQCAFAYARGRAGAEDNEFGGFVGGERRDWTDLDGLTEGQEMGAKAPEGLDNTRDNGLALGGGVASTARHRNADANA